MTFIDKFDYLNKKYAKKIDVQKFKDKFIAVQVTLTDEDCGGTFYSTFINGAFAFEPYDYHDNTVAVRVNSELLEKIITSKADAETEFRAGNLEAYGNLGHVLQLIDALKTEEKAEKKAKKEAKTEKKIVKKTEKKAAKAVKKAEEKKEAPKAEKKAEVKKEAPKAEVKAEVKKDAPKAEKKAEIKKEAPKAEVKAEVKKEAPKAEVKTEVKKDTPKAEVKAEVKKEAPKAEVLNKKNSKKNSTSKK